MKKLLAILAIGALAASAFAQGTVVFENPLTARVQQWTSPTDSTLIYVPVNTGYAELLAAATTAAAPTVPIGSSLETWLSTSAPGWAAVATTPINLAAGWFNGGTVTITGIGAGASAQYMLIGWTGSSATWDVAYSTTGAMLGESAVFTTTTANPTSTPPGTPSSLTTFTGPLVFSPIPEPSTFALAGLGLAALLVFRRRS